MINQTNFRVDFIYCIFFLSHRFFCIHLSQTGKVDWLLHNLFVPWQFFWLLVQTTKIFNHFHPFSILTTTLFNHVQLFLTQLTTMSNCLLSLYDTWRGDRILYQDGRFHDMGGHLGNIQGRGTCRGSRVPVGTWDVVDFVKWLFFWQCRYHPKVLLKPTPCWKTFSF